VKSALPDQEKNMRRKWLLASLVGSLGLCCALSMEAQTAKTQTVGQYIISAKAGGVNFVSGNVTVNHRTGAGGLLLQGDEVQIGDRVSTGEDGKAEILLNPGSFLRVGPNTSFEFASTDLEDLRMNLRAGSAIFEIIATKEFGVSVKLPQATLHLNTSGVFRIDVREDGFGTLSVLKGRAYIGGTKIASGHSALLTSSGISVAKLDHDTSDPLDIWSKDRAKEMSKLNAKLEQGALRNSLISSFNGGGWNLYNSFGLWVFDPRIRRGLFLPFGFDWSSPYGWNYNYNLWSCRMPQYVWNSANYQPRGTATGGSSTPASTPGTTPATTTTGVSPRRVPPAPDGSSPTATTREGRRNIPEGRPPFQRVEQETRTAGGGMTMGNPNADPTGSGRRSDSIRNSNPDVGNTGQRPDARISAPMSNPSSSSSPAESTPTRSTEGARRRPDR
jgi:hypothetical protein